jgi:hypothetical protein
MHMIVAFVVTTGGTTRTMHGRRPSRKRDLERARLTDAPDALGSPPRRATGRIARHDAADYRVAGTRGLAVRILVVDSHSIFRRGIVACLTSLPEVASVIEAESVEDAWARSAPAAVDPCSSTPICPAGSGSCAR